MISNRNFKIVNGVILILLVIGVSYLYTKSGYKKSIDAITKDNYGIQTHTIDSLQTKIDSLEMEFQSQAQKFDNKEKEYKQILFEYELGIDRIKNYHPKVYEDFHRILAYREDYSREAEIENKKRLNQYKNK